MITQITRSRAVFTMVTSESEHLRAQEELRDLEQRLQRMQQTDPDKSNRFTTAGIRKMIARLRKELAEFEGDKRD